MYNLIKKRNASRGGLLRMIIFIIIVLLVISYFGLNIRAIVNSPAGQENFSYVQEIMINVWNNYLKGPVMYVWHIFIDLIWNPAIDNLGKIKDNQPDSLRSNAPRVPAPQRIPN